MNYAEPVLNCVHVHVRIYLLVILIIMLIGLYCNSNYHDVNTNPNGLITLVVSSLCPIPAYSRTSIIWAEGDQRVAVTHI